MKVGAVNIPVQGNTLIKEAGKIAKEAGKTVKEVTEGAVQSAVKSAVKTERKALPQLTTEQIMQHMSRQRVHPAQVQPSAGQAAAIYKKTAETIKGPDAKYEKELEKLNNHLAKLMEKAGTVEIRHDLKNEVKKIKEYLVQEGFKDFAPADKKAVREIFKDGLKDIRQTLQEGVKADKPKQEIRDDLQKGLEDLVKALKEKLKAIKDGNGGGVNPPPVNPPTPPSGGGSNNPIIININFGGAFRDIRKDLNRLNRQMELLLKRLDTFFKNFRFHTHCFPGSKLPAETLIKLKNNAELLESVFGKDTKSSRNMIDGLIGNNIKNGFLEQVKKNSVKLYE